MLDAYICDAIRTPIGCYGGGLATVRADDLGAIPIRELMRRNPSLDWSKVDDVIYGCANQAGEDNRNVARMSSLLAGLPFDVAGVTVNRLCGSGLDALGMAARSIKSGEAQLIIAGGVESMSRAPLVMPKPESAYSRKAEIYDTTIGWRFVNRAMDKLYGTDSMPETAENVAEQFSISREDQDKFALASQQKTAKAIQAKFFDSEIVPVVVPRRKQDDLVVAQDEHPRADTSLERLSALSTPFRDGGSVTAGNASGVNDGACALLLSNKSSIKKYALQAKGRIVACCSAGVEPRIMGVGPAPAIKKVLNLVGLTIDDMDVIELNEAFAAQALAVLREIEVQDDDPRVNPNGGAIALGHPLGMSGARLVTTALNQLTMTNGRYALCTMCVGVGQGIAMVIERV